VRQKEIQFIAARSYADIMRKSIFNRRCNHWIDC